MVIFTNEASTWRPCSTAGSCRNLTVNSSKDTANLTVNYSRGVTETNLTVNASREVAETEVCGARGVGFGTCWCSDSIHVFTTPLLLFFSLSECLYKWPQHVMNFDRLMFECLNGLSSRMAQVSSIKLALQQKQLSSSAYCVGHIRHWKSFVRTHGFRWRPLPIT